jgi:hypothetical protein
VELINLDGGGAVAQNRVWETHVGQVKLHLSRVGGSDGRIGHGPDELIRKAELTRARRRGRVLSRNVNVMRYWLFE